MFFFPNQGLASFKAFFEVPMTVYTVNCICIQLLCEGIGPNLRKAESCDSSLAISTWVIYLWMQDHAVEKD